MSLSPSIIRNELNESGKIQGGSKSHSNLFPSQKEEAKEIESGSPQEESEEDKLQNQEELSDYSLAKSNNYEDLKSQNTSSKKNNYNRFFYQKRESNSEERTSRIQLEQLDSKNESLNSSIIRKEKNADNFIESDCDENVLNTPSDNDQNLNISSISKLENSSHSQSNDESEENKLNKEENKERIISRQPTFSRFTPQPKEDLNYYKKNTVKFMNDDN